MTPCNPHDQQTHGPAIIGEAFPLAITDVQNALSSLVPFKGAAQGALDQIIHQLTNLEGDLQEIGNEIVCTSCGDFNIGGEGFNGECGNCADLADHDDFLPSDDPEEVETDPLDPDWSYSAIYYDDEAGYRGCWSVAGEIKATTQLLFRTAAAARTGARITAQNGGFE